MSLRSPSPGLSPAGLSEHKRRPRERRNVPVRLRRGMRSGPRTTLRSTGARPQPPAFDTTGQKPDGASMSMNVPTRVTMISAARASGL